MYGNNVSHANNKTRRRFDVNLQKKTFWVESLKKSVTLKVSAKGLKIIDKKGRGHKDAQAAMAHVEKIFSARKAVEVDHLDGLSVIGNTWWFNLRPSNTEPLLRLNVEAKTAAAMKKLRDELLSLLALA